jgi:hypothetical protein
MPPTAPPATPQLTWLTLGQGSQGDLSRAATGNLTFYDIFTVGGKNCTQIYLEGTGPECLAVKKGRNQFAMFFETRRWVAGAACRCAAQVARSGRGARAELLLLHHVQQQQQQQQLR